MTTRDRDGRTELHYAALEDRVDDARRLLGGGADPNAANRAGMTPLHFAAQDSSLRVARILLDHGSAVDPADGFGNTPLMNAVFNSRGSGEMIQLLRSHGADPRKANNAGVAPVDLARRIGNFPVAQRFEDVGPAD